MLPVGPLPRRQRGSPLWCAGEEQAVICLSPRPLSRPRPFLSTFDLSARRLVPSEAEGSAYGGLDSLLPAVPDSRSPIPGRSPPAVPDPRFPIPDLSAGR